MDDLKLYGKSEDELEELVSLTSQFSSDIKMEFGLEKCASLKIVKGKKTHSAGISTPDGSTLQDLADEGYRYLGILESDRILQDSMKQQSTAEYFRRVKKLLRSSLRVSTASKQSTRGLYQLSDMEQASLTGQQLSLER
jgi:hypothetical protein